jgi:peptidoglycan/LPS O-acetylase OafA/YrhL
MTTTSPPKHDRLLELDVLRGLAAIAVVLYHFTARYPQLYGYPSPPAFTVSYGYLGVEFFFCISGFVIFMTLDRTRRPLDFVVSRFSRLWPAYIAAIALTFSVVHLFGLPGRATTFMQALVNLTMFQELLRVPHVDAVYWSLQVELIFYCWMFLAYRTGLLKHVRVLMSVALLPPIVNALLTWRLGRGVPYLADTLLLVDYAPYFVIGLGAYNLYRRREGARFDLLLMAAATVVASLASVIEGIAAVAATLVFCAAARGGLRWLANGPLIFFGTISYTLYLVHQNVGYIVIRALTSRGVPATAAIAAAFACAVCLAAALTWLIEKPALRLIRDFYVRHKQNANPSVSYTRV